MKRQTGPVTEGVSERIKIDVASPRDRLSAYVLRQLKTVDLFYPEEPRQISGLQGTYLQEGP